MANPVSESEVSRAKAFFGERRTHAHVLFAAACVGLADWLFYGHAVGWTLGAFEALSGAGIVLLGDTRFRTLPSALLGAYFLGLCLRAVVDPEPLVVFLGLVAWVAFTMTLRGGWSWRLACWIGRGFLFAGGLVKSCALAAGFLMLLPLAPLLALLKVKRLCAWVIPLLLGLVFLALFALANPVISLGLSSVSKGLRWLCEHLPSFLSVPRVLFWLAVGAWLWTLLRHRPRECAPADEAEVVHVSSAGGVGLLTHDVVRNALIVFNALFALQTACDLWYLWGGGTLPQGMTYAEYAHRGAYPLVVTALLAAGFVLVAFREGAAAADLRATRGLVYAWLLQNVFLVASAGWRLWLYVGLYSLTRLRLAACVWMGLVACGLVWILVRIMAGRSNLWLVKVNFVTAAVVLMAYCWSFPNMLIASFNVRHCREAGCAEARCIDLRYLSGLGYDALPALLWLEKYGKGWPPSPPVRPVIDRLGRHLDERADGWRGATPKRRYLQAVLARDREG